MLPNSIQYVNTTTTCHFLFNSFIFSGNHPPSPIVSVLFSKSCPSKAGARHNDLRGHGGIRPFFNENSISVADFEKSPRRTDLPLKVGYLSRLGQHNACANVLSVPTPAVLRLKCRMSCHSGQPSFSGLVEKSHSARINHNHLIGCER